MEHLIEPLLSEGIFPCVIETLSLCASPLLTTFSAASYTILTQGFVSCVDDCYVPLHYSLQLYSLRFFLKEILTHHKSKRSWKGPSSHLDLDQVVSEWSFHSCEL